MVIQIKWLRLHAYKATQILFATITRSSAKPILGEMQFQQVKFPHIAKWQSTPPLPLSNICRHRILSRLYHPGGRGAVVYCHEALIQWHNLKKLGTQNLHHIQSLWSSEMAKSSTSPWPNIYRYRSLSPLYHLHDKLFTA